MNPLTNVKNLRKMNEKELKLGIAGQDSKSWHQKYKNSAWIFVGGLPYELSEGDIISIFSQYGEIVNINLIRDHKTGKSRGFGFICFEDQRSTNLSVDNFNGIKILGRIIRVDHVEEYKVPKERGNEDDLTKQLHFEGCAPKNIKREPLETPSASISATVAKKPKLEPVGEKEKIIVKEEKKPVEIKKEPSRTTTTAIDKTKNTDKYNNNNRPVVDNKRSEEKKYDQKKTDAKIKLDFTEKKSSSGGSYRDKEAYVPRRYQK